MEYSAQQIAALVKGEIEGNPAVTATKLDKIEEAGPGSLTFLSTHKYIPFLQNTKASIVIITDGITDERPAKTTTLIKVKDSRDAFAILLDVYHKQQLSKNGIEQFAVVSPTTKMGKDVYVGSFSYIGDDVQIGNNVKIFPGVYIGDNTRIGDNCIIYAGVKIYRATVLGNNCTLHSGVVIGGDGFGFVPNNENTYRKMPQVGNVVIEDNVEVGSNSTIDRATMGSTIIRKGVKIDNLVQVAHNCEIGENTVLAAQAGVAGSSKVGRDCMIGGQVGIIGHLTIGNRVKIAGKSGIASNVPDDAVLQGSPALPHMDFKKSYVVFSHLPEINKKIRDLEDKISK
ncbi:MAG TPA: UDP-3-O-(3-hydroxymyristoyl)glucosamine N-acyltransferase [Bacteroidia bacterium]|nr:UDP-3-O-(3-hydroxymyristoyl)glucosamine N-acyltransferase [Bacteroidia bacterium]